ncbi:alpha/beta hydrolase [Staphylococcus massiliensis]|uniref:alpha/beta hydrolase n=1 Tax=Staphylococcus massiliensis TaxID=555791 RepID=UPI001EDEE647|nr:alpha/beta fold hydrolase [Staphylococcus massiliensis]MCG3400471.1 alpha/beta fold hydrolase [Staphylococcus massiliensis]
MKIKSPEHIYEAMPSDTAILLLHSFTGNVNECRPFAKRLNKIGYATYIPNYRGHGLNVSELVKYDVNDWYDDVVAAFNFLKEEGYNKIIVVGTSLGGLFTLKLAEDVTFDKGIIMSVPIEKDAEGIHDRLHSYGRRMNDILGFNEDERQQEANAIETYSNGTDAFVKMIEQIMADVKDIDTPMHVLYGLGDAESYHTSAHWIHEHLGTDHKTLDGVPDATHLMLRSHAKETVEQMVIDYIES